MSSLIVEVCRVEAVEPHPNADRMCVCTVKGWRVCAGRDPETGKNAFAPGDACVYFPPDCVLPVELSDRIGCTKYLSPVPMADGVRPPGGRVRVARLRGEPSYGLIMKPDDPAWAVGTDVAALYGVTKWDPPPVADDGDREPEVAAFHRYTDIENYRNFPDLVAVGEEVVVTEKIHGMNARLAIVRNPEGEWEFMAGSKNVRRRELDKSGNVSRFWKILTDNVRGLLKHLAETTPGAAGVMVFGELFGSGIQDMAYGLRNGAFAFRAFDVAVNGAYLDFDRKKELFAAFGVETVPVLYRGPFDPAVLESLVSGPTTMCHVSDAGKFAGREGVVVTPVVERAGRAGGKGFSRTILKAISFEYLERKGGSEYH